MNGAANDTLLNSPPDSIITISVNYSKLSQVMNHDQIRMIAIVALVVGIGLILVGYFLSGGNKNKRALLFGILASFFIGLFTTPVLIRIADEMNALENPVTWIVIFVLQILFVGFIAVHCYEIATVTTGEAYPNHGD